MTLVALDKSLAFTKADETSFDESLYSATNVCVESLLRVYDNVLTQRTRVPSEVAVTSNPRNFVYKIAH